MEFILHTCMLSTPYHKSIGIVAVYLYRFALKHTANKKYTSICYETSHWIMAVLMFSYKILFQITYIN